MKAPVLNFLARKLRRHLTNEQLLHELERRGYTSATIEGMDSDGKFRFNGIGVKKAVSDGD